MRLRNSKKQLAKIISENGGWRDGEFAAQDKTSMRIDFYTQKPWINGGQSNWNGDYIVKHKMYAEILIHNWHQTILSRDEYFHLYPAPDADGWIEWSGDGICPVPALQLCDIRFFDGEVRVNRLAGDLIWMKTGHGDDIAAYRPHKTEHAEQEHHYGTKPIDTAKQEPTIEQLTSDYRAKLAIAQQAQDEADSHRFEAEAALDKLVAAGKALGLVLGVAAPEPELVITDWRDLQVGDVVRIGGVDDRIGAKLPSGEYEIAGLNEECDPEQPFSIKYGGLIWWPTITKRKWRFIRRP